MIPALHCIVLDADATTRAGVVRIVRGLAGVSIEEASSGRDAAALVGGDARSVVFAGIADDSVAAFGEIEALLASAPGTALVLYSTRCDLQITRWSLQIGALDLLPLPLDRRELQRTFERAVARLADSRRPGSVVIVLGAKGGVGKTTIATNLAALAAQDPVRSALLVDLDSGFGDTAIALDLEPRFSIADLVGAMESDLTPDLLRHALTRHSSGAWLLAAPKHPDDWRAVAAQHVQEIVRVARGQYDFVIVDTPSGLTDLTAAAIDEADRALVVSSLEIASVRAAAHVFERLAAGGFPADRVSLVVNHAHDWRQAAGDTTLDRTALAQIPYDERVVHASEVGAPVALAYPTASASAAIRALASLLAIIPAPERSTLPRQVLARLRQSIPSSRSSVA